MIKHPEQKQADVTLQYSKVTAQSTDTRVKDPAFKVSKSTKSKYPLSTKSKSTHEAECPVWILIIDP